jgi:threonine synthase
MYKTILLAIDMNEPSSWEKALPVALNSLADFIGENVPGEIEVAHSVGHGTIYKEILATAERIGADLIVMASHRPAQSDYLLGPNAARVVRHATCSVLVVRA